MTHNRIRLLPTALLSAPVFFLSLLWAFAVQSGEGAGAGEGIGYIAMRLAFLSAVQVLMFAFPFFTWQVICPRVPPRNWTLLLLVSVVVGAVIRGVALGFLLFLVGVSDSPDLLFRIAASVGHLAVITVLLWFLVSEVRGLQTRRRQLLADRDQLLGLQLAAQRDLDLLGHRASDEIRRSILESLGGLQSSDSSELRERLRLTIDEVVRPLSHQLAAQPPVWAPPQAPVEEWRVDWPLAVREGLNPVRIHPILLTVLLIWLGLPFHVFQIGPASAPAFLATAVITIPTFWFARLVAIRLTAGRGSGAKATGFIVAILIGGAALGLATLPYMQFQPQPLLFVVLTPPLALFISAPFAIAEAARDQDLALESDLKATTADLRWTLARARERYRQQERALAHALHGRIQASLAAAFLRLERAVARGDVDEALLVALQAEVLEALAELDVISTEPEPIDKVIALTQSNWSGAVLINFSVDPQAREALAFDPLCARSVNDLVPELVFNSVRHGKASTIDVRLEIADHKTLSLTVTDDGGSDLIANRHGLGSSLLDEAAITWSRTRSGSCTTTTCLLPVLSPSSV